MFITKVGKVCKKEKCGKIFVAVWKGCLKFGILSCGILGSVGSGEMALLENSLSHLTNLKLLNVGRNHIERSVVKLCKDFDTLKILKDRKNSELTDENTATLPFCSMNEVTRGKRVRVGLQDQAIV